MNFRQLLAADSSSWPKASRKTRSMVLQLLGKEFYPQPMSSEEDPKCQVKTMILVAFNSVNVAFNSVKP